jgi:dienelactone hydrolase
MRRIALLLLCGSFVLTASEVVTVPSGKLTLHGVLHKPDGPGPFPAVVYNHGSGRNYARQFDALGPLYASHGYVFFAPYRRGQGLSSDAGPYIGDLMDKEGKAHGRPAQNRLMVKLLESEHLEDQLAGLAWLARQPFVNRNRIAVAGNSFGGIQVVLAAERKTDYCAAVDSAGAALTWSGSPEIRERLIAAVRKASIPIFFFQAGNDKDLGPSRTLSEEMKRAGKPHQMKIYPPFGKTTEDGHSFGYFGGAAWIGDVTAFLGRYCSK